MNSKIRIALMVLAAAVSGALLAAATHNVSQKGLKFSVEALTVKKGEAVVFLNDDRTAHNITVSGDGVNVNGGLQQPGGEFRMPFAKSGTYAVSCAIHPKMKMSVIVQ
jgi:plastocyanin